MKISEKEFAFLISSLVTQLSATPPATHRRSALTERSSRRRRATTAASVTSCSVAAKSMCRGRISSSCFRLGPSRGSNPGCIEGREAERAKVHLIALLTHLNDRRQLLPIDVGIAVGGEAHDLGGVVHREAEINARLLPQKSQGVRIRERFDGFDPRTLAPRECRAGRLADAVNDKDRGGIEAGRVVGRRGMREMMGHEFHCPAELPPQNRAGGVANLAEAPQEFRLHLGVRPPVRLKFRAANLRIERVRHPVDSEALSPA